MKNLILFIIPVFIWGSTWYVIKFQVGEVDPMYSVSYRFMLAGVIMLVVSRVLGLKLDFSKKEHDFILLQGLLLFGINYWLIYMSELYITSGLVGLIFSLLVLANIFNARIFLKTPFEPKVILGGIMGLGGTALVFWEDLIAFSLADEKLIGLFLAISGTYVASLGNITSARNQSKGIPVVSSNAYAMTYSGLTLLLIALISGKQISFLVQTPYIISLLYLAILGSVVAFGAYLTLIGKIGPSKASYVSLLVPIIAMIISTIFEDYQWSATSFSGAALILFGNGIAMYKPKPAS